MYGFLALQALAVAIGGWCIGALVSYQVRPDPARLPRALAWLARDERRPGSRIPPQLDRWIGRILAAGILAYTQYALVYRVLVDPFVALGSGPPAVLWFALDEGLLLAWTAYLVWAFRRAAGRSK
jgi:hypothetical protein